MLNKNAKKWVRALRSGKYKQAKNQLRVDDKFCCLGVACELAIKAGVIEKYRHDAGALPRSVQEWLGLKEDQGEFGEWGKKKSLADLNDDGKRFTTIANVIESEPVGLFIEEEKNA